MDLGAPTKYMLSLLQEALSSGAYAKARFLVDGVPDGKDGLDDLGELLDCLVNYPRAADDPLPGSPQDTISALAVEVFSRIKGQDRRLAREIAPAQLPTAVYWKDTPLIKALLEDVSLEGPPFINPLPLAILGGSTEILQVLLDRGFNPNERKPWREAPPIWFDALLSHRAPLLELLLQAGADISMADASGCTALHKWVHCRPITEKEPSERIVKALIEAGVCVSAKNNQGRTAAEDADARDFGLGLAVHMIEKHAAEHAAAQLTSATPRAPAPSRRQGL